MKSTVILLLFSVTMAFAQPNTDVFVMDLEFSDSLFTVSNLKNISNAAGYDNQPSFFDNHTLLFSGSEDGQT
ncbi:MAG: steroid delta-isomerase, partial [Marinirhabdus sp.]|nr:steroid delta-isomerase [Marinirhabdus sp.]